jgi:NAD+ synthase (glutamine-hydrolysing)
LLEAALHALDGICEASTDEGIAVVVGIPIMVDGRLFNCAAFIAEGRLIGIVPKSFLPNYSEFYEMRHFTSSHQATTNTVRIPHSNGTGYREVPFGTDLLFHAANLPGCVVGIEICEDLWAVDPPSGKLALAGATIVLNPSASPDQLGKADYRAELVKQQSARCLAAYVYAGSGPGESTMDVVFGGHSLIAENGTLLTQTNRFDFNTQLAIADVDLQRLAHERLINITFGIDGKPQHARIIDFTITNAHAEASAPLLHPLARHPFVPNDPTQRAKNCREIFAIQSTGLAKRIAHTGVKKVTIGISGGLDSTLAVLVSARAFDRLGLPREGIVAITMPGFGTTDRTYNNAIALMKALGTTVREIPIRAAVSQHFEDIDHNPNKHDVTYENAQARERTQVLMDVANQVGGFVVGTGDLSEAALGWMTFNGDHMSMYHVNAGVPKTLVRYMVQWAADEEFSGETALVLNDIVSTPISPELLPLNNGALQQKTEDTIGPYELHDFFLWAHVRYGYPPRKIFWLARQAFSSLPAEEESGVRAKFTETEILQWLATFYARFFSQQFKRSAMPDGPKVGSVALSPRGDWRMPSDARNTPWREEIELIAEAIQQITMR